MASRQDRRIGKSMGQIDIEHLRTWIGKSHSDEDQLSLRHARLMSATVDYHAPNRIQTGCPLPPLWHWVFFLDGKPAGELGRDGHPARGGFLPPVPLPNRMWAGGRVAFLAPLPIGASVRKESSILKVDYKRGRSRASSSLREMPPRSAASRTSGRITANSSPPRRATVS